MFFGSVRVKNTAPRDDSAFLFVKLLDVQNVKTNDDLYCKVSVGTDCYRTKVVKGSKPDFQQDFTFQHAEGEGTLVIQLWAKKKIMKDSFLGETKIDLKQKFEPGAEPRRCELTKSLKDSQIGGSIMVYLEEEARKKAPGKKKAFEAPAAIYNMSWDVEQERSTIETSALASGITTPDTLLVSGRNVKLGPLKLDAITMEDVRTVCHIFKDAEHTVVVILPRNYTIGNYKQQYGVQLRVQSPKLIVDRIHEVTFTVSETPTTFGISFNARGVAKKFKDNIPLTGALILSKATLTECYEQNQLTGFEVKQTPVDPYELFQVGFDHKEILRCLDRGDDINLVNDEDGETLLHKVVTFTEDTELIQILMENGANPIKKNKAGKSAIDYAELVFKTQHLSVLQSYLSKT